MKFTITNNSSYERGIATPGNTSIPVPGFGTTVIDEPAAMREYYMAFNNLGFTVLCDATEGVETSDFKDVPEDEKNPPEQKDEIKDNPNPEPEKKDEVKEEFDVIGACNELSEDQLHKLCDILKLDVKANTKAQAMIKAIDNSSASDKDILNAYNSVK